MGSTSISLKKLRLGKLKVVRRRLLQRYEHQPFISFLAGLYSCRWKRYQREKTQPGECCCKKWEHVFFLVLIGTFCLSLIFLYFWGEAQNDYNDFDWYTYGSVGYWFLWSLLILVVAAVLFTYIAILLILAVCLLSEGQRLYLHWSHKIGTLLVLVFSAVSLAVLSHLWGEEWAAVILSFQVTAPYLHIGAIAVMTLMSWPVALYFVRMNRKVCQVIILGPFLAILIILYLIPLGMYSPCIRGEGTLGPKPALFGHRGTPVLAPENTKLSFEKTIEHGAAGLETDVTMSYDGIPFLMHDGTLKRTTNVHEVYPNLTNENAAMFTWDALKSLNAGKWFIEDKPFLSTGSLSSEDERLAINQSIYKLNDFLKLAHQARKYVLFDLYRPPMMHPYRDSWIKRTLQVINESAVDPHLVLWLSNEARADVATVSPGFQQTLGRKAPIEELVKSNIVKLNLHYSEMSSEDISIYGSANITTNLYVISEPWLFSLAWCSGAHSVTTNTAHILRKIDQPLFLMTPQGYRFVWILTDVTSAVLIGLIFTLHMWRETGFSCCSNTSMLLQRELDGSLSEESDLKSLPTTPNRSPNEEIPGTTTNA
ncbi:glycerophosphodiester phosphodiesterase domain-containing protein 4 [Pleurodeles waltl]